MERQFQHQKGPKSVTHSPSCLEKILYFTLQEFLPHPVEKLVQQFPRLLKSGIVHSLYNAISLLCHEIFGRNEERLTKNARVIRWQSTDFTVSALLGTSDSWNFARAFNLVASILLWGIKETRVESRCQPKQQEQKKGERSDSERGDRFLSRGDPHLAPDHKETRCLSSLKRRQSVFCPVLTHRFPVTLPLALNMFFFFPSTRDSPGDGRNWSWTRKQ